MKRFKTPKDWLRVPLHEIAEVRGGVAKGRTNLKNPVVLPYLRVANVQDGHFNLSEIKTIEIEHSEIDRYALKAGDVLMTEGGDFDKLGRGAVWRAPIFPCLHQNHVFAVRPRADLLDPDYLSALSASSYGRAYFLACAKRSTNLASINSSQLKAFPVILPSLYDQKSIAAAIGLWDDAIATSEKLLANSKKQKKALKQSLLFGKTRLGEFTKPWRELRLDQVLTRIKRPVTWNDDALYPLISVRRRSGGAFHRESLYGREILTKKLNRVEVGDFLISKMQVVHGAMAMVPRDLAHMYVSDSYLTLRAEDDTEFDINFLGWLSRTPQFYRAAYRSSYGVHIEKMTFDLDMFLQEKISVPCQVEEQRRICEILQGALQVELAIEKQLERLTMEKAALMQQLLTGKRRVRISETEAESSAS